MNIRNYTIIILILIMSTTIISCNSLRSNEDNEKQELQSVEDNKQLLNEISNIRNEVQTLKKSIDSNTNTTSRYKKFGCRNSIYRLFK